MEMGLSIASLVISIVCLLITLPLAVAFVAKHYFSEHIIERVPVDFGPGIAAGGVQGRAEFDMTPPIDPFKEVGEPLTDEEKEYFERLNKRGARA